MISIKKFFTIIIIVIALPFSLSAYTDTYFIKCDSFKNENKKECIVFKNVNENWFYFDTINYKTNYINKKNKEEKESQTDYDVFVCNLLKLSMTLLGILIINIVVGVLFCIGWLVVGLYLFFKKP